MLTLYYKPTCPYSLRVLGEAEALGITMDLKDISNDDVLRQELIDRGGDDQTPFLVDPASGVSLYESGAIVAYLTEHHKEMMAKQTFNGLRIHSSDEICDSCQ